MKTSIASAADPPRLTAGKVGRSLRAFSLPASVLPVMASCAAIGPMPRWNWMILGVTALGVAMLHLAGNLLNDYFDFRGGVDSRRDDDPSRPGRLLVRGELTPAQVLTEALVCLGIGLSAGAWIVWLRGWPIAAFAAAGALGLYAYTGPPFRLKCRALGEPAIFLIFGPLLVIGSAWAQSGHFEPAAAWLGIPIGLATTAILAGNSYRDRAEDAQAGIRTLGQFADGRGAQAVYAGTVLLAPACLAALAATRIGPWGLWLTPLALVSIATTLGQTLKGVRLPDIDARTARYEAILLAMTIAAYVLT